MYTVLGRVCLPGEPMTSPNRESAEEANTALVQRRFNEVWSHGNGGLAVAANDRFRGTVLQLRDCDYGAALREHLTCGIEHQEIGRRIHPS